MGKYKAISWSYAIERGEEMNPGVLGALSVVLGAAVSGFITLLIQHQRFAHEREQLRLEYKTEFTAEETAIKLLSHQSHVSRRFVAIRKQLAGFEDDDLRKILVRSGAVCVDRGDDDEWWMLLSREDDYITKARGRSGREGPP